MGVSFPDLATLESTASAIGSNMFEGFEPTEGRITIIRDYILNKITFLQFIEAAKSVTYA
jgi:putative transcriptional regulator